MTASKPTSRRRGGQPGNRNAVRHGFYARYLPEIPALPPTLGIPDPAPEYIESTDITLSTRRDPINRLTDEIAMLRLAVRNIAAHSREQLPLAEELELLRSISLASAAINRLLRTQEIIYTPVYSVKDGRYEPDGLADPQGQEQEEDDNAA